MVLEKMNSTKFEYVHFIWFLKQSIVDSKVHSVQVKARSLDLHKYVWFWAFFSLSPKLIYKV